MSLSRACIVCAVLLAAAQAQGVGSVAGTVLDPLRATIPDAQLRLIGTNGEAAQTRSGRDGEFRFSNVPPGIYSIAVTSPGFIAKTVAKVRVTSGSETTRRVVLAVVPVPNCNAGPKFRFDRIESASSEIIGAVVGEVHNDVTNFALTPAENVPITATGQKGNQPAASARTDMDGHFKLAIQNPGRYTVTAHQDGHADFIVKDVKVRRGRRITILETLPLGLCRAGDRCEPMKSSDPVVCM